MKYDKNFLRNKFLLKRRQKYSETKKFDFNLIFKLIKKHFNTKKITIAGYYPSDNEVNILQFLKQAFKKKFKIALPDSKRSSTIFFVMPTPGSAAFSPLAITKSKLFFLMRFGRFSITAFLPDGPIISPSNIMFIVLNLSL